MIISPPSPAAGVEADWIENLNKTGLNGQAVVDQAKALIAKHTN